jgi:hypothetical protein
MEDLNPIFFQVKSNQHTISNINKYSPHIDRVMGTLFKKGETTHYVLNVEKEESINFDELQSLMDNIKILINNINIDLEFDEDLKDFYIKINLQSKGTLELIKAGKALAVLAYLLHLTSCNNLDAPNDNKIEKIIRENRQILDKTSNDIDTMRINTIQLTKPFKDGN